MLFGASFLHPVLDFVVAAVLAFLVGSAAEYAVHRLAHRGLLIEDAHANHHLTNIGQGVWLELRAYLLPALPFLWAGFVISGAFGAGSVVGALAFAFVAAYAHQLSHEAPALIFWQRVPVHYVHHRYAQHDVNFGIAVDWWDRLLGTYAPPSEPMPHPTLRELGWRAMIGIAWREPEVSRAFRPLLARHRRLSPDLPEVRARRRALRREERSGDDVTTR